MKPFDVGERVFNTTNTNRRIVGVVTGLLDDGWCEVLWSDGECRAWHGRVPRDGYVGQSGRIVRVKLSVRIVDEAVSV